MRATLLLLIAASLLVACAGPGPLSRSRPGAATTAPPPPPATAPAPTYPPPEVPIPPVVAPAPSPTIVTQPSSNTICIVLPLESPLYGSAAAAVKAGFLAAANAAGSASRTRIIAHGDDGVLPAFAAAAESGAALVVGPLTRDDLKTVLALALARPRMLALNREEDGSALPHEVYALSLSVESDAELLARRAYADGARTMATVASDAPLQRRFKAAFSAAWRRTGGSTTRDYRFDAHPEVLSLLRRELLARPPDAMLLAVNSDEAPLVKSFLPPGPVYASSQIADGLPAPMLRDLDGVRYVEIPWLADPADVIFARLPHTSLGDPVLDRLYALGLDAFAIAELLANPIPPDRVEFEGATGHLSLTPSHVFVREGQIMVIRAGQPMPYAPTP
ncbi:MAG TPA: penicillin-binding protein activator [Casimicrobiaceae bacterium]